MSTYYTPIPTPKGICRAIAGIMHYLLTAYCISMILEGTLLHRKASRTHKAPAKGWVILLCVWGKDW